MSSTVWLTLAVGFLLLLGGGEGLVKGSVSIATRLRVSPLLIGLTLVGFGTSTPELVASVEAALIGAPGVAMGNIVGSNIANILLIVGLSALIYPLVTTKEAFRRDGTVLIVCSMILIAISLSGILARWAGVCLLGLLAAYVINSYLTERRAQSPSGDLRLAEATDVAPRDMPALVALVLVLASICAIVYGADLLVQSSIVIARSFGLSEAVIGLTLVAVGTSLPELATSVMAAIRRQSDVAFGNIVGSNIFNILGIGGATALLSPIAIPAEIIAFDIWVMFVTAILLVFFAVTDWRVSRAEGLMFLLAYAAYIVFKVFLPVTA